MPDLANRPCRCSIRAAPLTSTHVSTTSHLFAEAPARTFGSSVCFLPLVNRPRFAYNPQHPLLNPQFSPTTFIRRDDLSLSSHFRLAADKCYSIDPNIKNGLLAVAWRMTTGSKFQVCGFSGKAENCFTTLQCQTDIYLDTTALKIEWTRPELGRDNLSLNNESGDVLLERGRPVRSRHWSGMGAVTNPNDKPVALGIPNAFRYGDKLQFGGHFGNLAAYDHSSFSGIALLSYRGTENGVCPLEARFNGGQFQVFDVAESKQPVPPNIRTVAYSLHIPDSFYARIRPIYDVMNKPNEDAINNLLKSSIQQRERSTDIEKRQPVK